MTTREEALSFGLSLEDTYQDTPFRDPNWVLVRYRKNKKAFLWTYELNGTICLNVKVDPFWRDLWREAYASVIPAYHQNKEHWNTLILDGTIPEAEIRRMILESYDLITDSPTKRIYEAVKKIPKGQVATYSQVAKMAGNPKMCRAVGNALHKNPDPDLVPCYRVVNARGELSGAFAFGGPDVQKDRLEADGIEVKNGKVDLEKFGMKKLPLSESHVITHLILFLLFPIFLIPLLLSGCGKSNEPITKSGMYFDTIISVTLYDASRQDELDHCFEMAEDYEAYFSATRSDSDVSRINASVGMPVEVHAETAELIQKGLDYCELSEGKFDITVGKLTNLWDYQAKEPKPPTENEIKKVIEHIDYHALSLDGTTVTLSDPDAALDLGGIAKGYIADKMKDYLLSEGVTSGIINLGGNVLTIGNKDNGEAYNIGIQKPFGESGESIAAVQIKDQTVVSSGIYERYFEQNGILYHHILDVSTGYPYQNGLVGVSIICKSSTDGDGLSTTCFALGLDEGLALVESLPDTEAIFITEGNELHYSSGIGTSVPIQELE